MRQIETRLARWLEAGGREIGEIVITSGADGFELRHRADAGAASLETHRGAEAARRLATFDDAGRFRPLKTAPTLRRGWTLHVADLAELRRALDFFYPAMIALWHRHREDTLQPVTLRETLGRQTGMYRVTQKLTDAEAQALIGRFCRSHDGCLKHLLWPIAPGVPIETLPAEKLRAPNESRALPLLCHEACNLLVAEARAIVKSSPSEFPA